MKSTASFIVATALIVLAVPASAQFAKPEDAVKYRQSSLFVLGQHFSRIGAMVNGRVPYDAKVATDNAEVVASMARLPWAGFTTGTENLSRKAKADIWTEQAKFKDHNEKLVTESGKLLAAAKTSSLDNLKVAFGSTAGTCKACHDGFRND